MSIIHVALSKMSEYERNILLSNFERGSLTACQTQIEEIAGNKVSYDRMSEILRKMIDKRNEDKKKSQ